jgi:ribosomal protein S19
MQLYNTVKKGKKRCVMQLYNTVKKGKKICVMQLYNTVKKGKKRCVIQLYNTVKKGKKRCVKKTKKFLKGMTTFPERVISSLLTIFAGYQHLAVCIAIEVIYCSLYCRLWQ